MKRFLLAIVSIALLLSSAGPAYADTTYVIQSGDTLGRIATRFGINYSLLLAVNGITNPNLIYVGQVLILPGVGGSGTAITTSTPAPNPVSGGPRTYVVQPGDNLFRISLRYGISLSLLMAANGITNASLIRVGQVLVIPDPNAPAPTPAPAPTQAPPGATPPPATPAPAAGLPADRIYVVRAGDVLWRIALRFGVSAQSIIAANGITNPNRLLVGQRLYIPDPNAPAPTPVPTQATPGATQPPPPPPSSSGGFELGGQVSSFSAADKMKYAGMLWVKRQVKWHPGYTASADLINDAHARGFKILLSVLGDPGDISGGANFDAYAAYVADLARMGADAIEVWNEMNLDREWPAGQISPVTYTELLRRAYTSIKAANSATLVISGAPSPTGAEGAFGLDRVWNDDRYINGLAAAGAASYMDCIGIHYNEGIISPKLSSGDPRGSHYTRYYSGMVNTYYNAFGGARKLCFTELGYLSPEGYGPLPSTFGWAGSTTAAQQAQWLGEVVSLARGSGQVRLLIVFNVDFTTYGDDPQAGYAMIRPGGGCPACESLHTVTGGR